MEVTDIETHFVRGAERRIAGTAAWVTFMVGVVALVCGGPVTAVLLIASSVLVAPNIHKGLGVPAMLERLLAILFFTLTFVATEGEL